MTSPASSSALPTGYRLRRPVPEDAGAVAALRRAIDIERHGDSDVTIDQVHEEWALPRLSMAHDLWVVEDPAGALVGYGLCWIEAPPCEVVAEQIVHPAHRGRGLSEALLDLGEARVADLARAAPPGRPISLGVWAHERDAGRLEIFAAHGYRQVRTFRRLERGLDAPVAAPAWPEGIIVRGFRRDQDEAAVHAAGDEAFRDHFRPEEMSLDEWLEFRFSRSDLDVGLWLVAWVGAEVAGSIIAFETPLGGYLDELFVRRPWRGRGLGRALLLHECAELRRRGLPKAYLGVDAENPTGAVHLYEAAGFTSRRGAHFFLEKDVPSG